MQVGYRMKKNFLGGLRISLPVCLGVIPVGISYGLIAVQSGLTVFEATMMSVLVMAGASQVMAVGMISQGAAIMTIWLATFLVNLRHIVMSSSVMARLRKTPISQKLVGAFALCDESFAIFSLAGGNNIGFLLGTNTALYATWIFSSVLGCVASNLLPELVRKSFGIAFYASFIAILLPSVKGNMRFMLLVLLTGVLNALLQMFLSSSWSVILSMILGAAIGCYFVELPEK